MNFIMPFGKCHAFPVIGRLLFVCELLVSNWILQNISTKGSSTWAECVEGSAQEVSEVLLF